MIQIKPVKSIQNEMLILMSNIEYHTFVIRIVQKEVHHALLNPKSEF